MDPKTLKKALLSWIEERQPLIAFQLVAHISDQMPALFAPEISWRKETQVLVVEGLPTINDALFRWLEDGGQLLVVEKDPQKIAAYLLSSSFRQHDHIYFSLEDDYEMQKFFWDQLFRETEFIGDLKKARYHHDVIHLTASEYRDFGRRSLVNIQRNLLHTKKIVDGRTLHNAHKGQGIIICGSGPTLKENLDKVRELRERYILLASGSSLPKLLEAGIVPDYFLFIDPEPPLEIYDGIEKYDFPLIYQNRMCSKLMNKHKGEKIWMGHSGAYDLEEHLLKVAGIEDWQLDMGWHAGNAAHVVAKFFGCAHTVTVGMDGGERANRDLRNGERVVDGMITRRDLHGGERVVDGMITRRDLQRGLEWNQQFEHVSSISDPWPEVLPKTKLRRFVYTIPHTKEIEATIQDVWDPKHQESIEEYFKVLIEGVDPAMFEVETALFESQMHHTKLFQKVLQPLWVVLKSLYLREAKGEGKGAEKKIAEVCFYKSALDMLGKKTFPLKGLSKGLVFMGALEGLVKRVSPDGRILFSGRYFAGKEEGLHETWDFDGHKLSEVRYWDGKKNGPYRLYREGVLKKCGNFVHGLPDGKHISWENEGQIRDIAEYKMGQKSGHHQMYNEQGILIEELHFHSSDCFDKKQYRDDGELIYEGVWQGSLYREKTRVSASEFKERMGEWSSGGIVWET